MSETRNRIGLLFQVFRTNEVTSRFVTRALESTGIRGDDYAVYSVLLQGPMTLTRLANLTGMPLTTASGYAQRFEHKGTVIRLPNPDDGRSRLIALTEESEAWILQTAEIFAEAVSELNTVMADRSVDSEELIDQLELIQGLIETAMGGER